MSLPANAQQAEYWQAAGASWVTCQDLTDRLIEPITTALMDAVSPAPGQTLLDIGCGCGATVFEAARRVGPRGRVLGVDISATMLDEARRRAQAAGASNVEFVQADAQTADFGEARFETALSRFGVMFFEDPVAAFGNIRRSVKTGGRLVFAAWRSPMENPFFVAPAMAVAHLLPPSPPPDPNAPGQFSFADPQRVRDIVEGAGWRQVEVERLDVTLTPSLEEAKALMLGLGPAGAAIRQNPELKPKLAEAMGGALDPFRRGDRIAVAAACWLVTASA